MHEYQCQGIRLAHAERAGGLGGHGDPAFNRSSDAEARGHSQRHAQRAEARQARPRERAAQVDGGGREEVARAVLAAVLVALWLVAFGWVTQGEMQDEQRLVTYYEQQGFDMSYRSW